MPLTINPVVQDSITVRREIVSRFFSTDPIFFSRLTPADIVMNLNNSLSFVMRKNIVGAVVLGVAAKVAGLQVAKLRYQPDNKWTVNVSLTDIQGVLTEAEKHLLPLSDNITLNALQKLGLRVLQRRYNVSLGNISESLYTSTAMTFQSIQDDWIQVVKFITETNVNRLAARYRVSVSAFAQAFNVTSNELYAMTLDQLDGLLSTRFTLVRGSLKIISPTVVSSSITEAQSISDNLKTITLASKERKSPITFVSTELTDIRTQATSMEETSSTTYPTTFRGTNPSSTISTTVRPSLPTLPVTTIVGNLLTDRAISLYPTKDSNISSNPSSKRKSSGTLTTSEVVRPTKGTSVGEKDVKKLALLVGVPAALLLLLVASSTVWCLSRKRRYSGDGKNKKNNNDIKIDNFWIEKNDGELATRQDEPGQEEQIHFMRSPGAYAGFDSRFKGIKYVPTSSTFDSDAPLRITKSRNDFENDSHQEIFV